MPKPGSRIKKKKKGEKIGDGADLVTIQRKTKQLKTERAKAIKKLKPLLKKLSPEKRNEIKERLKLKIDNAYYFSEEERQNYMSLKKIQNLISKLEKM